MSKDISSLIDISSLLKEWKAISIAKKGPNIELNINEKIETNTGIKEKNEKYFSKTTKAIIELIQNPKGENTISENNGYNNKLAGNMDYILNNWCEINLSYWNRKRIFITLIRAPYWTPLNACEYWTLPTSIGITIWMTAQQIRNALKINEKKNLKELKF